MGESMPDVEEVSAFRRAISVVGVDHPEVLDLLGGMADEGPAYLVGSLAAGLGNARSDLDLHLFVESVDVSSAPVLFFIGPTAVDIQRFPASAPEDLVATCADGVVSLPLGPCALGPPPQRLDTKRLSRWATAVPLDPTRPALVASVEMGRVQATLSRAALDEAVLLGALAVLTERTARSDASVTWGRAGRAVAELATRLSGDLFIGDKWTWQKVARAGIDPEFARACSLLEDESGWSACLRRLGIDITEPRRICHLRRREGSPITLARSEFVLLDRRRLVACPADLPSLDDPTAGALVRSGAASLAIDHAELDERLLQVAP